ncbi:MAG: TIGR01212 family radical SAM protein [Acutalibacteraceae bacterium]|nr:TIGR01212 family radical SAM protein [Acutalibacteraceae bacterium]
MSYYSANQYYKSVFNSKVYKISLNGGMTCPNRDGTKGRGGCIFCSNKGSGDFSPVSSMSINSQIEESIARVRDKIKENKFIAYFQSFTNTYAPVSYLENIFIQAINHPSVVGLSIGTRPDCLGDDVLQLLDKLNKIKPVFVEIGLQTIHEKTAEYINRCYPLSTFDTAVKNLKSIGVNVIVHTIIGLPDETEEMIYQTVDYVGKSGADGIKLQLLHILENTALADDYSKGKFSTLTLEKYTEIICNCIEIIPASMVIHRITGDGAKNILIAPLWSGNKKLVLNTINKAIKEQNIVQGSKSSQDILRKINI